MNRTFIRHVRIYVARYSVSASAARGQGAKGLVAKARAHLEEVQLGAFGATSHQAFLRVLDRETDKLESALPRPGRSWGMARKLLNLFLRNALYTSYLRSNYGLWRSERWYEVPLDGIVGNRIRREASSASLPPWPGVKGLKHDVSDKYQQAARTIAREHGVAAVHLDAWYWGGPRTVNSRGDR